MKMIARMFCAAALVLGAISLTGCGDKTDEAAKPVDTNAVQKAADKATDALKDLKGAAETLNKAAEKAAADVKKDK